MRYRSALIFLPLIFTLTACGSGEAGSASSSSSPESSSSSASPAAAEALSGKATCDRLVGNGDDALGLRVADYTVEIMSADSIEQGHYVSAGDLRNELDELAEVADPLYAEAIEDLKAGPQAVVDAVEQGDGNLHIPAQDMLQAGLDAGEECLSGPALDEYANKLTERIEKLPEEYGGKAGSTAGSASVCAEASRARFVTGGWELVAYSKGARDHQKWAEEFEEDVAKLSDDSEPHCTGDSELAALSLEAMVLNGMVEIYEGEAEPGFYESTEEALREWLSAIGRDDLEVVSS